MQCPQCHNQVPVTEAQYGALYTCPKCMAVYFVNFDGMPEYGDMSLDQFNQPDANEIPTVESDLNALVEKPVVDYTETFSQQIESVGIDSEQSVVETPYFQNESESQENFSSESIAGVNSFDLVAQEIQNFANQDEVISEIYYSVVIKGIDSKEIRDQFKESIEDSKFAWIAKDILDKVQNGQCQIERLNPIQAYVLAQRLQFMDLDCHWEQHVQV